MLPDDTQWSPLFCPQITATLIRKYTEELVLQGDIDRCRSEVDCILMGGLKDSSKSLSIEPLSTTMKLRCSSHKIKNPHTLC
jgi:hypothetical protein